MNTVQIISELLDPYRICLNFQLRGSAVPIQEWILRISVCCGSLLQQWWAKSNSRSSMTGTNFETYNFVWWEKSLTNFQTEKPGHPGTFLSFTGFLLTKKVLRYTIICFEHFGKRNEKIFLYGYSVGGPANRTLKKKKKKNLMSSWLAFLKLKGLLASEISKFTKICKFQKNLYANLRLLNDYGLIISIKTKKKAYVCVCFIFKIGDATSARIYFTILVHGLK